MVSFEGINETDSNGWVNFSKPNDETRSRSSNLQKQSDVDSSPPRLSLPLEHYCMIAEKVFISFLRSYRSLYINDSVPSREKVTMLGKRLQTFLSVVLPSHSGFALVEHDKESRRIKDMTSMLREYLDKVQGKRDSFLTKSFTCIYPVPTSNASFRIPPYQIEILAQTKIPRRRGEMIASLASRLKKSEISTKAELFQRVLRAHHSVVAIVQSLVISTVRARTLTTKMVSKLLCPKSTILVAPKC
jgi:hypothetical protein